MLAPKKLRFVGYLGNFMVFDNINLWTKYVIILIKAIIEALMKIYKPTKFHLYSTSASNLGFALFHFLWNQYLISLHSLELKRLLSWLRAFSKAFIKVYYFSKFHWYIVGPTKVIGCSIFNYFLTNCYSNFFWIFFVIK